MAPLENVGKELAEVPFGDLISNIAQGIADGQRALDVASIQTLIALAQTEVEVIPEVTEVLSPDPFTVPVSGHPPVEVTGVRVEASASQPVQMSALQAGILPTFYQFTEATIALKLSLEMRQADVTQTDGSTARVLMPFGSHVNFRTQSTFSYSASAASTVNVTMRPVPPDTRLVPSTITVNALGPKPTVTTNP
ncbi:MAG: hypothetical protein QOD66_3634 [Solirubrobacteraceae bacterium]|jgi:hypothetical protein|nr:hypothetical protein [Solirubrobacteraceae bacterium]